MTVITCSGDCSLSHSLWDLAHREADAFKWYESERCGYDVGPIAHREWSRRFWRLFCRHRRLEHVLGKRRIREFDEASFGSLRDPALHHSPVVRFVMQRFVDDGWENLHFMFWATGHGFALTELRDILRVLDVNSVRFDPPWS